MPDRNNVSGEHRHVGRRLKAGTCGALTPRPETKGGKQVGLEGGGLVEIQAEKTDGVLELVDAGGEGAPRWLVAGGQQRESEIAGRGFYLGKEAEPDPIGDSGFDGLDFIVLDVGGEFFLCCFQTSAVAKSSTAPKRETRP